MRLIALLLIPLTSLAWAEALEINAGTPTSVTFEAPALESPTQMRVAILPDRTTGWPEGIDVLDAGIAEIQARDVDFAVTVGDMINGYTRLPDDWMAEMEEWKEHVAPLDEPIYPTAGNHDTWPGTHTEELDHSNEALYEENFGPLYYSFDVGRTHFVMLYSDEALSWTPSIGEDQIAWLREDLASIDADHLFVFLHRPMWEDEPDAWEPIHDLLVDTGNARAVIAGHIHTYERYPDRDGIMYLATATCGGAPGGSSLRPPIAGGIDHWCLLTVDGDEWNLEVKEIGGEWLPNDYVLSQDSELFSQIERLSLEQVGQRNPLPVPPGTPLGDIALNFVVTNPLSQEVTIHFAFEEGRDDGWSFAEPAPAETLAAGASREIQFHFAHEGGFPPILNEPQLNVTYDVTNSRGQTCPITLRRRIAWIPALQILPQNNAVITVDAIRDSLTEGWDGSSKLSMTTFNWTPWETHEGAGMLNIVWTGDDHLNFFVRIRDDRPVDHPDNTETDPISDVLLMRALGPNGWQRDIALFPNRGGERNALIVEDGSPEAQWTVADGIEIAAREHINQRLNPGVQLIEVRIPTSTWLGPNWHRGVEYLVNVEMIDSDERYFTSTRSIAPTWSPIWWGHLTMVDPANRR